MIGSVDGLNRCIVSQTSNARHTGIKLDLAESGKVELSVTPWSHPILPLLIDFESAREAMPGVELPSGAYPEGERPGLYLDHKRKEEDHVKGETRPTKPGGAFWSTTRPSFTAFHEKDRICCFPL